MGIFRTLIRMIFSVLCAWFNVLFMCCAPQLVVDRCYITSITSKLVYDFTILCYHFSLKYKNFYLQLLYHYRCHRNAKYSVLLRCYIVTYHDYVITWEI